MSRALAVTLIGAFGLVALGSPVEPSAPTVETVEDLAREYVFLVLRIDRHRPGFNDAYSGPPEWIDAVDDEDAVPIPALRRTARSLAAATRSLPGSEARLEWFRGQLLALETTLAEIAGEPMPWLERQRRLLGLDLRSPTPESVRDAWKALDALEHDREAVADRFEDWWAEYLVEPGDLGRAFDLAFTHVRRSTAKRLPLPAGESILTPWTERKTWWAYTWFQGDAQSVIEVNRSIRFHACQILHMAAHEGYPGHHAELTYREHHLLRGAKQAEWSVLPYWTPQTGLSEAMAEAGAGLVFEDPGSRRWLRDVFLPALGHADVDIDSWLERWRLYQRIRAAADLEYVWSWCRPDREDMTEEDVENALGVDSVVRRRLGRHPGVASFGPSYSVGGELVRRFLAGGEAWERFRRLAGAHVHPAMIERWIREDRAPAIPAPEGEAKRSGRDE